MTQASSPRATHPKGSEPCTSPVRRDEQTNKHYQVPSTYTVNLTIGQTSVPCAATTGNPRSLPRCMNSVLEARHHPSSMPRPLPADRETEGTSPNHTSPPCLMRPALTLPTTARTPQTSNQPQGAPVHAFTASSGGWHRTPSSAPPGSSLTVSLSNSQVTGNQPERTNCHLDIHTGIPGAVDG